VLFRSIDVLDDTGLNRQMYFRFNGRHFIFNRTTGDKLVIDDVIAGPGAGLTSLREHGFFSTVYMASARYFRRQDLRQAWSSPELAEGLREGRELRRRAYPRP